MTSRNLRSAPAATLAAVVVAAFAFRIGDLGFYNDDWGFLAIMQRASGQGLLALGQTLSSHTLHLLSFRPVGLIFYPALFKAFGTQALGYQLVYLLFDLAVAWNFYAFLAQEGVSAPTALLAATFAALYPTHDATHHCNAATASCALAATLWSLRRFRVWQRCGGARPLAEGAIALGLATLLYETAALLPLLLLFLAYDEARIAGLAPSAARWRALKRSLAPVAVVGGSLGYQRVIVPRILGLDRHPVGLRPLHAFHVFLSGAECTILNRLTDKIFRSALYGFGHFGAAGWFWYAAAAALIAWICIGPAWGAEQAPGKLAWLGLGFFALGYLPYVFDAGYTPDMFDAVNRVNLVPSLGGAAWLAWMCARQGSRAAWLAPALAAALLLGDLSSDAQWADAGVRQEQILASLDEPLRRAPDARCLLLYDKQTTIGSATVFDTPWDFDGALAVRYGPKAPHGLVPKKQIRFESDAAVMLWYGQTRVPYDGLYAYLFPSSGLLRIDGSTAGAALLASAR